VCALPETDLKDLHMAITTRPSTLTSSQARARRERRFLLIVGAVLVAFSAILYAGNILVFRSAHDTLYYLWIDLAFMPLEVLIVGLIVERIVTRREKGAIAQKLNMVIGAFFSELGMPLLARLLPAMQAAPEIRERLHLKASWKKDDFSRASHFARDLQCAVDLSQVDLYDLRAYMLEKRDFILRLLENPNLIEHDRFTDLLWAVMHVVDELEARPVLTGLLPADEAHLELDARRAYSALMAEWILYVEHLKSSYPYLFSLVVRMHPFQQAPSATVTE
jgi:hypothetical protein